MILPIALVGAAAANVGVNAYHAVKLNKMQQGFQKKLDSDANNIEYIRLLVSRLKSLGNRIAKTTPHRPGTKEFEALLKKVLINDMLYKSYCNADIYFPMGPNDVPGRPRDVWASINSTGYVKKPTIVPPDVGPIWAAGCKNAHDEFRITNVKQYKGERRFDFLKTHKIDVGTLNLLLKFGAGIFLLVVAILMIKLQSAVIEEQKPFIKARKKTTSKR